MNLVDEILSKVDDAKKIASFCKKNIKDSSCNEALYLMAQSYKNNQASNAYPNTWPPGDPDWNHLLANANPLFSPGDSDWEDTSILNNITRLNRMKSLGIVNSEALVSYGELLKFKEDYKLADLAYKTSLESKDSMDKLDDFQFSKSLLGRIQSLSANGEIDKANEISNILLYISGK